MTSGFRTSAISLRSLLNDNITAITPIVLGSNENSSHNWILIKTGNLYHLHYERLSEVSNTSQVHIISSDYAPSSTVHGFCYYKQASGYAKVRMNVYSTGSITLTAETYNENVAGVFDAYWTKG